MRRLGIFLAALLVGALAVSGQERADDDELAREIDRLRALLRQRAERGTPPAEATAVRRIHDVMDLNTKIASQPLQLGDLTPSKYPMREDPRGDLEPVASYEVDMLIEVIKGTVEPASWDTIVGADIQPKFDSLFVVTIPRVQGEIENLLGWLRRNADRRVAVEVAVVPVREGDAAILSASPRTLTEEEAASLLGRERLGTVALTGWDGQIVSGRVGRELTYVQDYDTEIARESSIGQPIPQKVFSGCTAEVLTCLDDQGGAVLHCQLEFSRVPEEFPTHATEHGEIELPTKRLTRVQTSFWAPLGRPVVAGGCTAGDEPCIIVVTAHRR